MALSKNEVAFVLGRGGTTKLKVERVARCKLDLREQELSMEGSRAAVDRAKDYVKYILDQRVGDVHIDLDEPRSDLTVVDVPEEAVGFVMGRAGAVLRSLEEEWGTLMFFAKRKDERRSKEDRDKTRVERLAIFGECRGRRGAELKVLSAVEQKCNGWFMKHDELREPLRDHPDDKDKDWGYETRVLRSGEYSYALGARGTTRKKLALAAGCILEFVGMTAFFAGSRDERQRGKDYLEWLIGQRDGGRSRVQWESRDDVDVVKVPRSCMGWVTGHKGEGLRRIEKETSTFCFANKPDDQDKDRDVEPLLIFGHSRQGRKRAIELVDERIASDRDRNRGRRRSRSRSRSRRQRRSPSRSRSRSPRHSRRSRSRSRRSRSRSRSQS